MKGKRQGKNSTGGTRPKARPEPEQDGRPAAFEAHPALLALLRSTWGLRRHLTGHAYSIIERCLARVQSGPLSDAQLEAAKSIGASVGVGYDDPAYDDPPVAPEGVVKVERWGALPKRPPSRTAA